MKSLGRRVPKDFKHVEKYPFKTTATLTTPAPVVVGVNWYSNFDKPVKDKDGKYWVGRGELGAIRGGHCICMPHKDNDTTSWYTYYDQGNEGACVGFGSSRMMSLLNRKQYDPRWLWNEAKKIDEWEETNTGDDNGTSVRAAMDVLRLQGHVLKGKTTPDIKQGIEANRWATNVDDLLSVLQNEQYKKLGAIPFLNSWGKSYPHKVWMPMETWSRLMNEDGEFSMVADRI